jgi:putative membrane protein
VRVADQQTRTRDMLANERTFLAWLRTAATVMVLGLAIAKFADVPGNREIAAGSILIVTGALGVFEGARRQRRVARAIEDDEPMPTGGELVAAVVLVVAVFAALILLLV